MGLNVGIQNLVFFDLETTGLDFARDEIIQIGAVSLDADLSEVESFEVKIKCDERRCSPEPLAPNHFDTGDWQAKAVPQKVAARQFSEFLKRYATFEKSGRHGKPYFVSQLIGHNAAIFDGPFLRAWYQRQNEFLPAAQTVLCTIQRAQWYFFENQHLPPPKSFSLLDLCSYFGIDFSEDSAHDALMDTRATVSLYRALSGLPVLNRSCIAAKVRYYQSLDAPWNVFVAHNGDCPPSGYKEISPDAVTSVSRLLESAGKLKGRGLTLSALLEKAVSYRTARVYADA